MKAYTYDNGLIPAETSVVDELAASIGSANRDIRSLRLNFETNAVLYDPANVHDLRAAFVRDLGVCSPITRERLDARPGTKRSGRRSQGSFRRCSEPAGTGTR